MMRSNAGPRSLTFAFLFGSVVAGGEAGAVRQGVRPNLVVIMADDLDVGSLKTMIDAGLMPHAQRHLLDRGCAFSNSFVSNSVCCPSRATFLTGQFSHNNGVQHNGPGPNGGVMSLDHSSTLATWLQAAGYRTGHIGKYLNLYGVSTLPTWVPPGWDDWQALIDPSTYRVYNYRLNDNGTVVTYGSDPADYQTDVLAGRATRFIETWARQHRSSPFFLVVTPLAPHVEALPGFAKAIANDIWSLTIRPAPRHQGSTDFIPLPQPPSFNEADVSDKPGWLQERPLLTPENVTALTRQYRDRLASLRAVDDLVGSVTAALEAAGALEQTTVLFTSDNGYFHGEHRLSQKMAAYEEAIRVPLVVRGQGVSGPQKVESLVLNVDLAPTLAELAGATPTRVVDGRSIVPLLRGRVPPGGWRKRLLLEHWKPIVPREDVEIPPYGGLRAGPGDDAAPNSLFVRYRAGQWGTEEFYPLAADPYQLRNRADDPAESATVTVQRHRLRLLQVAAGDAARALEE